MTLTPGVSDRAWGQVSVSSRECLGASKCAYGAECFAEAARERAKLADVVVTNHALLAIDAIEGAPVLPSHEVLIIDEAHELVSRVTGVATGELTPARSTAPSAGPPSSSTKRPPTSSRPRRRPSSASWSWPCPAASKRSPRISATA